MIEGQWRVVDGRTEYRTVGPWVTDIPKSMSTEGYIRTVDLKPVLDAAEVRSLRRRIDDAEKKLDALQGLAERLCDAVPLDTMSAHWAGIEIKSIIDDHWE